MPHAQIGPIAVHLPEKVETNDELQQSFPNWDLKLIEEKTGIHQRHIAAERETSSDLAVAASKQLLERYQIDPSSIDFVLFCTQTPDYPLPTTSCLIQDRLSLPTSCGALDFNLGCSGYVYGLAMADGLIQGGMARRSSVAYRGNLYQVHRPGRPESTYDIRRCGGCHTDHLKRSAFIVGLQIWQRRQWR